MKEIWKDIPNFVGLYQISNFGNVRSLPRKDTSNKQRKGKILKFGNHNSGYLTISLWYNNKGYSFLVHRLVMLAFIGECPDGLEVHHIDHDKHNNHLSNLRYVTSSENNIEAVKAGRLIPPVMLGESHPDAKLTTNEVLEIRARYSQGGISQSQLATLYKVSKPTIKDILKRRSWKHI